METLQSFRQAFDYDHWANRATLESLSSVAAATDRPLRILGHVLGAQFVWRARFDDPNPPSLKPWPVLTEQACRSAVEELHRGWIGLLDQLPAGKLEQELVYRLATGMEVKTPIRDVLTHLLMHSAYHRGQVAAAVREAGGKPAVTDYVYYLREKK